MLIHRGGGVKALSATAALWIAATSWPIAASPVEILPAEDNQAPAALTSAPKKVQALSIAADPPPKKNWFARAADYLRFHAQRLFTKQDQAEAKAADYEQKASRYQEAADFSAESPRRRGFFQRIANAYQRAAGLWRKQADKNLTAAKAYQKKADNYEYLSLPEEKRLARKTAECLGAAKETLNAKKRLDLLQAAGEHKPVRTACEIKHYPDNALVFFESFPKKPGHCYSYPANDAAAGGMSVSGHGDGEMNLSLAEKRAKLQDCQNKLKALAPKVMDQCRESLNAVLKDLKTRDLTAEGVRRRDITCNPPYPYKYDSHAFWQNSFEGQIQCFNKRKSPIDFVLTANVDMELNAENKLDRTKECVRFLEDSKIKLAESKIESLDEELKTCLIKKGAARQAALKERLVEYQDIECTSMKDWIISSPGPGQVEARNVTCHSGVFDSVPGTILAARRPVSCSSEMVAERPIFALDVAKAPAAAPLSAWDACVQDAVQKDKRTMMGDHLESSYTCQAHYGSAMGYRLSCSFKDGRRTDRTTGYRPYPSRCGARPPTALALDRAVASGQSSGSSGAE